MKAITIKQPWAQLIVDGLKDIENRDWSHSFRGVVAVHASKRIEIDELVDANMMLGKIYSHVRAYQADQLKGGVILGTTEIYGCVRESKSPWFVGQYGFLLRNTIKLVTPIPVRGALGFWDLPAEIEAQLMASPSICPPYGEYT